MTTLPIPRALLTTLLNSLSTTPSTLPSSSNITADQQQTINPPYNPPSNPLKALPTSHRALLTTLHVLLPTGVLLQALDLLDRGLVVRYVQGHQTLESEAQKTGNNAGDAVVMSPRAHAHLPTASQDPMSAPKHTTTVLHRTDAELEPKKELESGDERKNSLYIVRSSQAPKSRFRDPLASMPASNLVYTVRVEAWNCSCAAFAFEAFPGGALGKAPWLSEGVEDEELGDPKWKDAAGVEDGEGKGKWAFGGLSCDGLEEGKVSVCKHLLACVLAERWGDVLGGYVKERLVGREEMAGVGGEG